MVLGVSLRDDIQLKQLTRLPFCIALCNNLTTCCSSGTFCCNDRKSGCMYLKMDYYSGHLTSSIRLSHWAQMHEQCMQVNTSPWVCRGVIGHERVLLHSYCQYLVCPCHCYKEHIAFGMMTSLRPIVTT